MHELQINPRKWKKFNKILNENDADVTRRKGKKRAIHANWLGMTKIIYKIIKC